MKPSRLYQAMIKAARASGTVRSTISVRASRRHAHKLPTRPYLGDWNGPLPQTAWQPQADGQPDPGEVVWAWIPFEEDHTQGKDRPAVLIARHPKNADVFLALPLTSKDHDRDKNQERRAGRLWMDVGTGPWDQSGRASEVRINRILQLREEEIRREGSALDRATYDAVIAAARSANESSVTPSQSRGARTGLAG